MSQDPSTKKPTDRQPYEPPRIVFRGPLESMAAVCAPSPPSKGTPAVCPTGPISS